MQLPLEAGSGLFNPLLLLFFTLATHGIILLNDGLYWDGWNIDSWQRRKDWNAMKRFFSEVGMPLLYYQHKFIALFSKRILIYRLIALTSTYVSALAIYLIATDFGFLNRDHALLLSLLYLSYTGYHMNIDTMVGYQYTFPTAVFYTAVFAAFSAYAQSGYLAVLLHVVAIVLFIFSFNANSLLVYYFGFVGLSVWHQTGGEIPHLLDAELILRNVIYVIVPFVFWVIKEKLTPRHGHYANYNRIAFSLRRFVEGYVCLMRYGFEAAITLPVRFVFANGWAWISVFLSLFIYLLIEVSWGVPKLTLTTEASLKLLAAGLLLLNLAGLPYILVGQRISDQGWGTKNAMLLHLPVAMTLLGLLTFLTHDSTVLLGTLIFFILASATYVIRSYLYYLAAYVKDRSWLFKLKNVPGIEAFSLFQVIDYHWLKADSRNPYQDYASAYLHSMFDWLWRGKPCRFGIREFVPRGPYTAGEVAIAIESTTLSYVMGEVNKGGRQARVIIKSGKEMSLPGIVLRYIKASLFDTHSNRMSALLDRVTEIEFIALDQNGKAG